MKSALCKFKCMSIEDYGTNQRVKLAAHYDPSLPEDQKFSVYTPNGGMDFTVQNPALDGFFKPGETYLITIEKASQS